MRRSGNTVRHYLQARTALVREWLVDHVLDQAPPWLISTAFHTCLLLVVALIPRYVIQGQFDGTVIQAVTPEQAGDTEMAHFELGQAPLEPTELNAETLKQWEFEPLAQTAQFNDDSPIFEARGGGTETGLATGAGLGFDVRAFGEGPVLSGGGGVDMGLGTGAMPGRGGSGSGFGLRGSGNREAIPGVTKASERAVGAALNWLARHQNRDGSWSIDLNSHKRCKDGTCTGSGSTRSDAAATALAILPFLGAGETHEGKGVYQKTVLQGVQWLIQQQKQDGDLSGGQHQMYSHGLAALALCEAYGMTQDSRIRHNAQSAIKFIESAQNELGGWRYTHGTTEGDTSVFGWQVMALKSGKLAGLEVDEAKFQKCRTWLEQVASGYHGGKFAYLPGHGWKPSMTGVGLLTLEYLGATRKDRAVGEAIDALLEGMPTLEDRDVYCWYYATLALHNVPGREWDRWNRSVRRILIETQSARGCSMGSWNPKGDAWGPHGGRLFVTALSALTLEVYYRYLPLYQLEDETTKPNQRNQTPENPVRGG
jgi:hypothetical protein